MRFSKTKFWPPVRKKPRSWDKREERAERAAAYQRDEAALRRSPTYRRQAVQLRWRGPRRLLERRQDGAGRRWSTAAPADLKVPGRGMRSCPSTPLRHMQRAAANAG
ncbi:hypothetical protein MRX96_044273 [Rhipicephalus microplus]